MIKILVVYHYFPHYRLPVLKALSNQENVDLEYTFLSGSTADIPINILMKADFTGLNFISVKNRWFFGKILWQTKVLWYSISNQYDCVVYLGNPNFTTTWLGAFFARVIGKPVLFWTHGFLKTKSFSDKIRKIFFRIPNALLLYGNKAKDNLISRGFNVDRLFVIYNSLDFENQIKVRNNIKPTSIYKNYFKNDYPVILYIGRLQKVKKIDLLIKSVNKLNDRGTNCNLIIIGEKAEELSFLNTLIKNRSNIWLYGSCYDENKIGELIFNASTCVSPGNVGLTALHSLVYGTPIITHDNFCNQMPEFEAITDGLSGTFFKEDSIESLCLNIEKWIGFSDQKRELVRNNCYKIIDERYNPYVQIAILNKLLNFEYDLKQ